MKKSSGVTIIEIAIALITVAILIIVSTAVYRDYTTKAKTAEGLYLVNQIKDQEELNLNTTALSSSTFEYTSSTDSFKFKSGQVVDATSNKYFTTFAIRDNTQGNEAGYIAETFYSASARGKGIKVSLTGSAEGAYTINTEWVTN